uniref:ribosomal protein L20 n=1 Tax=Galdieria phlegrea TaxID=1389228 RepID=UPI0023D86C3D|nr:ribosomal protein L20 [Galdieria phlegrea]UNJ16194.1 ribosomal protein L20 [Galdieria sp.]WDA99564.1 ribosomal protein L20 [Galdieria sulphuraria]WDA99754.1 ribosomal protein L20 [Galdieria phlegrea]
MTRVKRGNVAIKRRKKILRLAKGYRGSHSKLFRIANQQVMKALKYSYIGRKLKKRNFRSLWIIRINAALRQKKIKYNDFIAMLKKQNIGLNRKVISQLALIDNETFNWLIEKVKK